MVEQCRRLPLVAPTEARPHEKTHLFALFVSVINIVVVSEGVVLVRLKMMIDDDP